MKISILAIDIKTRSCYYIHTKYLDNCKI